MKFYPNKSEILYAWTVITGGISSILYSGSNRGDEAMADIKDGFKEGLYSNLFSNITSLRFSSNYLHISKCHLLLGCQGGGGDV